MARTGVDFIFQLQLTVQILYAYRRPTPGLLSRMPGEEQHVRNRSVYAPKRSWKKPRMAAHDRLSVFSLYRMAGLSEPSASGLVKLCAVPP